MRFLVTGASGYIGTHLCARLKEKYPFAVIATMDRKYGPVEDLSLLQVWTGKEKDFDAIFHLAADSNIDQCNQRMMSTFCNNIQSTANLLGMISSGQIICRNFIFASSAAVYGQKEDNSSYVESDLLVRMEEVGNSYGLSKAVCENMLAKMRIEYGMKYLALRLSNVTGQAWGCRENHYPETHLIPKLMDLINTTTNGTFQVYGNVDQVRDYINVMDVCDAMISSYEKMKGNPKIFGALNISTDHGWSVKNVIGRANELFNPNNPVKIEIIAPRMGDRQRLILNNSMAKKVLDWKPILELSVTLQQYSNQTKGIR